MVVAGGVYLKDIIRFVCGALVGLIPGLAHGLALKPITNPNEHRIRDAPAMSTIGSNGVANIVQLGICESYERLKRDGDESDREDCSF